MKYLENKLNYEEYYYLRESIGWTNFSKRQATEGIKNSRYTILAVDSDKPLGMARLVGDGLYYVIVDVIVHPKYQGQKIGTELINRLLEYIENNLNDGEKCSVQLISANNKEEFYEKLGFVRIPNLESGFGMQKIIRI